MYPTQQLRLATMIPTHRNKKQWLMTVTATQIKHRAELRVPFHEADSTA